MRNRRITIESSARDVNAYPSSSNFITNILGETVQNVKSISLETFSVNHCMVNIQTGVNDTFILNEYAPGGSVTITIPQGTYFQAFPIGPGNFFPMLQSLLNTSSPSGSVYSVTFYSTTISVPSPGTIVNLTTQMLITLVSGPATSFNIDVTGAHAPYYQMGFYKSELVPATTTPTTTLLSPGSIHLEYPNYIFLFIQEFQQGMLGTYPTAPNSPVSSIIGHWPIPVEVSYGDTILYEQNTVCPNTLYFAPTQRPIGQLTCQLFDQYGVPISNLNNDWIAVLNLVYYDEKELC